MLPMHASIRQRRAGQIRILRNGLVQNIAHS